ncbi:MAG: Ig-like domain-containing protein, partial [Mycobacterium sp.]|nr:Ig-like domain-containing protein [Mycobacterium sp.]
AGGLDTYTAKSTAFTGTETIAVSATLTDTAGNTSGAGTLTLNPVDTTAPAAPTLTEVTSNGSVLDAGQTVTFTLTASEALTVATGATLTLSNGATALYNSSTGKFVYTVASGQDISDLKVTGYSGSITDAAGNALAAGGVTLDTGVKIDTTAPTVLISNTGGNTNQSAQTISGTVDIGDVGATVNIYDNGGTTPVATTTVQSDGTWSKSVTLVSGTNSLTAQVTDGAGNAGTSNTVIFTLNTVGPSGGTPVLAPSSDSGVSNSDDITNVTAPTFTMALNTGTVVVGDTVQLLLGGSPLAHPVVYTVTSTDITNGFVSLAVTAGDLGSDGSKSISAQLSDSFGNSNTTAALVITLDTTAPAAPTVSHLADPANNSFDAGFTVAAGAAVTVTVNGTALSAGTLAADFTKSTAGGLDTYTAKSAAFAGTETIAVSATLTDAAGNTSGAGTLTLNPVDTTAPAAPTVSHLADPANGSFDAGFTVAAGAAVTVTVNGTALSAGTLAADFTKSTAGGLDTYTAKSTAFTGTETIAVSATLTDTAGNTSGAGTLTLNPVDTTAPSAPTVSHLADPANNSFDAGFTVAAGAAVTVTVNGTPASVAADFTKSTAGGLDTYTAKSNVFAGTETIAVSATLTDTAGNTSSAGTLTLNPVDTTAP